MSLLLATFRPSSRAAALRLCPLVALVALTSLSCGGRSLAPAGIAPADAAAEQAAGHFFFDCVVYDVGCPPAPTIGSVSQEALPSAIAVGSSFEISFTSDGPSSPLSLVPASPGFLTAAGPLSSSDFPGISSSFRASAPGSAEVDAVGDGGILVSRVVLDLVQPSTLVFLNPDATPAVLPLALVPMGPACLYTAPTTTSGERLAGVPSCRASASNGSIALDPGVEGGVVCINGESYGQATVTVTCGAASASFDVVLAPPVFNEDAGGPPSGAEDSGALDAASGPDADDGTCGAPCPACHAGHCTETVASGQDNPFAIAANDQGVYWTNLADGGPLGSLMMAAADGGAPVTLAANQTSPRWLAADASRVYWTTLDAILAIDLDGGSPVPLATNQGYPGGLAVDGANLYWTNEGPGEVMEMPLDGGPPTALVSLGTGFNPTQIVAGGGNVYWFDFATYSVYSVPIGGGSETPFFYDSEFYLAAIGIDHANLYYTEQSAGGPVGVCPLDGGAPTVIAHENGTLSVASDGFNVYFTSPNGDGPVFDGAVHRVPLDGGPDVTLATGGAPEWLAVNGSTVYWIASSTGAILRTAK